MPHAVRQTKAARSAASFLCFALPYTLPAEHAWHGLQRPGTSCNGTTQGHCPWDKRKVSVCGVLAAYIVKLLGLGNRCKVSAAGNGWHQSERHLNSHALQLMGTSRHQLLRLPTWEPQHRAYRTTYCVSSVDADGHTLRLCRCGNPSAAITDTHPEDLQGHVSTVTREHDDRATLDSMRDSHTS